MQNKKFISKTLISFLIAFAISPLFHIHIHHEISGAVTNLLSNDMIDIDTCEGHKEHGCYAESLLDHLFEHGVIARTEGCGMTENDSMHFDEINGIIVNNISFIPRSIRYTILNKYALIDYLLSPNHDPRSPPLNS
jgi:hypothetical protein